jgi:hypothetical protein
MEAPKSGALFVLRSTERTYLALSCFDSFLIALE